MISEEEYKRTLIRIWDSARRYAHRGEPNCEGGECWLCPLEKVCNPAQKPRVELFRVFEAINIVEKWGKEHSVVTNRGKFKEVEGDCHLKSVDGLIEFIKKHSYPVKYDTNSIEQGMTITGIEQAIKEYCEVQE